MKILSKYTKSPLMALLSVILPLGGVGGFLSSCSDWDDHYENEAANSAELTLWDAIQQRSELSDFAQVLEKTMVFRQHKKTPVSYADLLKGGRSFTLFAPVNGTFNKDSILSLVTTANGDSAVERFFIMNHLSQNLVSADGTEKNFRLLNYKNASFADNKVNNVGFRESNIHSKNGIMHVMDRQLPYMMTIYETLVALPQFKSHGEFLASYNEDEFNESASVSSGIVDGKKIYIDSVMIERNKLMNRVGRLNAEDSLYYVVIPTEAGWNKAWNTAFECFKYPKTNKDADSLQHFYAYCALMDDAVYSYYQQKAHIESYAYPYPWINPLAYPGRQLYTYSDYPFSPTGIFGSAKERYQCSNGMIFASDEWVFDPTWTYNTYRFVEGENESSVISYTYCTMTKIDALGDSISARAFTHIKPSGGNSNWNVTYKLTNALSTTYDVYVRVLPKSVTGGENKRPCRFTATINYYDEEGKEQHYTFNNGTPINTNPNIVDVVKVGTFKIPTCNFGQGDGGQPSITLTCSIRANENAKYDRNFYLDEIILDPVVKE
jgi:hypothetical protein